MTISSRAPGRHFLQLPGPTNVPDRVLRAIDRPVIDHRGPEFGELGRTCLEGLQEIFQTAGPVVIYPASGTGAWEAALVNTLSQGDAVLMADRLVRGAVERHGAAAGAGAGLPRHRLAPRRRSGRDRRRAKDDRSHRIKAVCVVHNETSTGCVTHVDQVRRVMDELGHPALLMVDAISSLGAMEYRHDEWGVDVTICGSQKGLMMPPGLSFNAISAKAMAANGTARLPRNYWDWPAMLAMNATGYFPYTPGINLLFGLVEVIKMMREEGYANIFARHDRHAEATRRAVRAWGLETQCAEPRDHSSALTAVRTPEGHSADRLRAIILEKFNMSLGTGLGLIQDRAFRIGHLGDFGDLQLMGTLSGVEMGLRVAGVPHRAGGAQAAMDYLAGNA